MDVLESEYLLEARLANTVAYASIHANPAADAEKGMANVNKMYVRALDAVPYLTVAHGEQEKVLEAEREQAIQRYRQMQARLKEEMNG